MIVVALLVGALVALLAYLLHGALHALIDGATAVRDRAGHDRELHHEQVNRILADFGAERQRWDAERAILLNRIQDPAATAFTSNVLLAPPANDVDMEFHG